MITRGSRSVSYGYNDSGRTVRRTTIKIRCTPNTSHKEITDATKVRLFEGFKRVAQDTEVSADNSEITFNCTDEEIA